MRRSGDYLELFNIDSKEPLRQERSEQELLGFGLIN